MTTDKRGWWLLAATFSDDYEAISCYVITNKRLSAPTLQRFAMRLLCCRQHTPILTRMCLFAKLSFLQGLKNQKLMLCFDKP